MTTTATGQPPNHRTGELRERARSHGLKAMNDTELLALLLGSGARGCPVLTLAHRTLQHAGGLPQLEQLGTDALCQIPGLGPVKALRLAAGLELGRRIGMRRAAAKTQLHTAAAVAQHFTLRIGDARQEQLWVASLDRRNRLRGTRMVALGGQHLLLISVREILGAALRDAASGFVLVHNHPSGDCTPSPADIRMTQAVARAATLVGMPLLDHVVVTAEGRYTSLAELGMVPPPQLPEGPVLLPEPLCA